MARWSKKYRTRSLNSSVARKKIFSWRVRRTGLGVQEILEAIVERIPAPAGNPDAPLQALIFDSVFNSFRGIIVYYRILNGSIRKGDQVKFVSTRSAIWCR